MSKYSTEELVDIFNNHSVDRPYYFGFDVIDAIIAKLRAGEKLCEAAKEADHLLMQNNYDSEEGTRKVLRKAIAKYEGEKP